MGLPLFCYGTLVFPAVMRAVTGLNLRGRAAVLPGYRVALIAGRNYPGIAPADDRVGGVLYPDPGPLALARLDRFEGREYRRLAVRVTCASQRLRAWVYLPYARRARLSDAPWDPQRFAREDLDRYLAELRSISGTRDQD